MLAHLGRRDLGGFSACCAIRVVPVISTFGTPGSSAQATTWISELWSAVDHESPEKAKSVAAIVSSAPEMELEDASDRAEFYAMMAIGTIECTTKVVLGESPTTPAGWCANLTTELLGAFDHFRDNKYPLLAELEVADQIEVIEVLRGRDVLGASLFDHSVVSRVRRALETAIPEVARARNWKVQEGSR